MSDKPMKTFSMVFIIRELQIKELDVTTHQLECLKKKEDAINSW